MLISDIISILEAWAPPMYQESYDNAGLITGNPHWPCTGVLCCLDSLEATVLEAVDNGCNLIVAHHPIVFSGLKKLTGKDYVERTLILAIKHDIAIYAVHTNLDNISLGVSKKMADVLGLINCRILDPKSNLLYKLVCYVPVAHAQEVLHALFSAGAGQIGDYKDCSFRINGKGSFLPMEKANPVIGTIGEWTVLDETRIEVIFPLPIKRTLIDALLQAHPYEEVAYDIFALDNTFQMVGSGMIGDLADPVEELKFLETIKMAFKTPVIRHTPLSGKTISKVALCGGAGSFLTKKAISAKADIFITADVKYHEFFDADNQLVIADIGHWESEQFTIDLLFDILVTKFPTFAVLKSAFCTNPVLYYS